MYFFNQNQNCGLGERINIIMQGGIFLLSLVFFKLINVINWDRSQALLNEFIKKNYKSKGDEIINSNLNVFCNNEIGSRRLNRKID